MAKVVVDTAGWVRGERDVETVKVTLEYDTADAFAVRVHIESAAGRVCWTFGRDLLADGLRSMFPIGEGAVQVQATSVLTEISHIDLDGECTVLRLPWWNTREFIRLSQVQAPRGEEICDVDSWVVALTGSHDG